VCRSRLPEAIEATPALATPAIDLAYFSKRLCSLAPLPSFLKPSLGSSVGASSLCYSLPPIFFNLFEPISRFSIALGKLHIHPGRRVWKEYLFLDTLLPSISSVGSPSCLACPRISIPPAYRLRNVLPQAGQHH
jgi:hypothetical protein